MFGRNERSIQFYHTQIYLLRICDVTHVISFTRPSTTLMQKESLGMRLLVSSSYFFTKQNVLSHNFLNYGKFVLKNVHMCFKFCCLLANENFSTTNFSQFMVLYFSQSYCGDTGHYISTASL